MDIVCVGAGYVGSVTGVSFATLGNKTTVIDINKEKVELINAGKSPIYEPGLEYLIEQNIGKSLFATSEYQCISEADVIFIAVETPRASNGGADLKFVKNAAKSIGENINKKKIYSDSK
ncbi:MAG: hypothetical protein ACOYJ1_09455 [Peptococcales bacterium]|jgi:UDPglucose 6-dehydrogenase